ncbi:DUF4362 domain-containing protein [Anaerobacillus sp. CMMVII]|uniref:DUF4362 domain-containing protein n=1 Tax=Anaerobacillus sp. CMMVII TaxID=2755588 RepID=UPI0021B7F19F|nr:DUF4362 domain-containing protein [Anaerobacillus sp. CMMVII]MCT8138493.1 DUF4362 domain-containing protein [Anaerobacillus sp. CMMVII]
MNQILRLTFLLLFLVLLSACGNGDEIQTNIIGNPVHTDSNPYSSEVALKNGDIVLGSSIQNLEKFYEFITNMEVGEPDAIRVTSYTNEGAPIYQNLVFNEKIEYTIDFTQDPLFSNKPESIQTTTCDRIVKKLDSDNEAYVLSGCEFQYVGDHFLFTID